MTHTTIFGLSLVSILFCAAADEGQIIETGAGEPVYRGLFESGFYNEAIHYLLALTAGHDSAWSPECDRYLAFCYIMTGNGQAADSVFRAMLDRDSTFRLSPIMISPKIFDVYASARRAWEQSRPETQRIAAVATADDSTVRPAVGAAGPVTERIAAPALPWYRIPLCLAPGGAGQFHLGKTRTGVMLLGLETAALAGAFVSYRIRNSIYDPRFGWYENNLPRGRRYDMAYRFSFAAFIVADCYGIIDALMTAGRGKHDSRNREKTER